MGPHGLAVSTDAVVLRYANDRCGVIEEIQHRAAVSRRGLRGFADGFGAFACELKLEVGPGFARRGAGQSGGQVGFGLGDILLRRRGFAVSVPAQQRFNNDLRTLPGFQPIRGFLETGGDDSAVFYAVPRPRPKPTLRGLELSGRCHEPLDAGVVERAAQSVVVTEQIRGRAGEKLHLVGVELRAFGGFADDLELRHRGVGALGIGRTGELRGGVDRSAVSRRFELDAAEAVVADLSDACQVSVFELVGELERPHHANGA